MAISDILVKLKLDDSQYNKGLKKSSKNTDTFSKKGVASVAKLAGGFLTLGLAVQQITKGFKDLAQETQGIAKVRSVLKSTNGVAGVTAEQIENITLAMQKNTLISQDAARDVASLGLTFTKINKDIFPEYLKMSADMATVTGQDMAGSALQLGKALQDPILGATSLRRVGVNLTQQQSEQIKVFVKMGQAAKAQAIIMKELAVEFGGAAKAVGMTFFGSVKRAMNAVDDFRKAFIKGLGAGSFGGVQKVFEYIINNQEVIGDNFRKIGYIFTHNFILDAIKSMGKLLKFAWDGWMKLGDLWEDFFGDSFFTTVAKGWKMLFVVVQSGWQMIVETVTNGIINPIEKVFNKIKAIGTFLSGGDFGVASALADLQNRDIDARGDNGFSSNINSIFEKMNADVFSINSGQDVRQRDADFAFSKSTFDLAGDDVKTNPVLAATVDHYEKTEEAQKLVWENASIQVAEHERLEADKRKTAREKELARQEAFRSKMLSITTQTFSGMETAFNVLTNESLNGFGKTMGVVGGFSSLADLAVPGLGSAIGAGASFLGTVFGQKEEESSSVGGGSLSDSLTADTSRPGSTISKTADTINYIFNNRFEAPGVLVGEGGMKTFVNMITDEQQSMAASTA